VRGFHLASLRDWGLAGTKLMRERGEGEDALATAGGTLALRSG